MEEEKRQRVLEEGKGRSKLALAVIAVVVVAAAGWFFLGSGITGNIAGAVEIEPMDYSSLRVDKQTVTPVEDGNLIGVSLEDLKEYRMVFFRYADKPVLIYADQYGKIVTSISVCEPCRNDESFFIQNNQLVCGKCFTKWSLGSHTGISGGCKEYPPAIIEHQVKEGNVLVSKADVENWRPRV